MEESVMKIPEAPGIGYRGAGINEAERGGGES